MSNYKDPEVLEWVNSIREKDGRKPLKRISYAKREEGERWIVYPLNCNCPIAVSLVDYVVTRHKFYPRNDITNGSPVPSAVTNWIGTFDQEQQEGIAPCQS